MIDGHERALLARSLRGAVEAAAGSDLDGPLDDLGWHEALRADRRTAVAVLFEACGELGGRAPLGAVLGAELRAEEDLGEAGVLLPAPGEAGPPRERRDDRLVVRGVVSEPVVGARSVLVAARRPGGVELHRLPVAALDLGPALPLDPFLGWHRARAAVDAGEPEEADVTAAWERAVAVGRLALAHELAGAARRLLELARAHAVDRVQFGRPIAAFQAVRHRLADSLVAADAAADAVEAAWDLGTPAAARAAKAVAGSTARQVGRHAQQVLAGMGFTAEHPLPAVVKRTLVLDQALGSSATLTRTVGEELLAARALPAPLPL